ncbi:MAG: hypothetical protein LBD67_03150 [Candidatus Accumulibacter sp.]|jgi:phosphoserine aminotransferase|nr:hypothetical protein [Accumulibacter sp.]
MMNSPPPHEACGLLQIRGHRTVGGMRASTYNAVPLEGVQALVDFIVKLTPV